MQHDWIDLLDDFGRELLWKLGINEYYLPTQYNPITRELKDNPHFIESIENMDGFSRIAMSRVATICQMAVFDANGGPEGDGQPKALRRHWYSWYKTEFAQPLAIQIGDFEINSQGVREINDLAWTDRLSVTYAEFVDSGRVTYRDLWVEDASRMMANFWDKLFTGCHIIVAVEKDSLFNDFRAASQALGATSIYSGKGKSSKAAIEKLLRDHFSWRPGYDSFSYNRPLIILHISDYDYDGESVIGPTFAEQARRYTSYILEARVGVQPEQVSDAGYDLNDKWYQVKVSNSGYRAWASEKALFMAQCIRCGRNWPVTGIDYHSCPECGGPAVEISLKGSTCYGLEVESLTTRAYYGLIVDALLQVLPFKYIVERLRDDCVANAYDAADRIMHSVCEENSSYQGLLEEFARLEAIKEEFENRVRDRLNVLGEPHIDDWRDDDDDPEPEDFREYVQGANSYSGPWRPFSQDDRTSSLVEFLREDAEDEINDMIQEIISW